ncbi:hypothetical protein ABZ805_22890 [Saccharopolyspora sp. NPDC047091]|uniref:hypothetical protein n=1 Tax=Saccharopolyspora sp. NPDC047091 TaxID=3155924 RepID=UPI0033EA8EC3
MLRTNLNLLPGARRCLGAAAAGVALLATPGIATAADLPSGSTAAHVVVDDATGRVASQQNEHQVFRSASVVKLLIALDYFDRLGPSGEMSAEDRAMLEPMLRSSNDDAASAFWVRGGGAEIIERSVAELGLADTVPPPADDAGVWGYTGVSAADVATTYRYLLHEASPRARDFVLGNLEKHTRCAADGFDQSFGLPSATDEDVAVKQGWAGFGEGPEDGQECAASDDPALTRSLLASPEVARAKAAAPAEAAPEAAPGARAAAGDLDLTRKAMHTTGIVDGEIVVLLTLQPEQTDWRTATEAVTAKTTELLER